MSPEPRLLPNDDPLRRELHQEVHARPPARIHLPALVIYVAVLNEGISRSVECEHLRRLPGQASLAVDSLDANFLRLKFADHTVKWERHSEFSRYSIVQALPGDALLGASEPALIASLRVDPNWLRTIPGRTVAAIKLGMLTHALQDPQASLHLAQQWLGARSVAASLVGRGHSMAVTDFKLGDCGFERMLVISPPGTSETRAGRLSQRLLEIETYRLMALRGLPVAKALAPMLAEAEAGLSTTIARLEAREASEAELLDRMIHVATRVERATAEHQYRFSATQAYDGIVKQRIAELREQPIAGTQMLGEFMQRRLSPAIATVAATERRLASISQRVERASALLRTRVEIAAEAQNQLLLAQLTRGQQLQLNMQATVEGLSIAAISYYVVSLVLYGAKALKSTGWHAVNAELVAGASIPFVLWIVWRGTRRIHDRLQAEH